MTLSDLLTTLQWWGYIFLIGLIFFPLAARFFSSFFDKGYLFAKVLGISIVSYIIFVLGVTHIAPFTQLTIFLTIIACAVGVTIFLIRSPQKLFVSKKQIFLTIIEESIFLGALLFWTNIRAHQPEIFGLEKYMDFGFVNSILRSTYFPPRDMWYTPLPINYYYFGHLITAVLTKASHISPFVSFNLMIATLFAFTYSLGFSLAGNLWSHFKKATRLPLRDFLPAGVLGGFLLAFGGNLHALYTLFKPYPNDSPVPFWQLVFSPQTFPNSYWYPNATRFIFHTIHEFPIYSFVVSDLHGHVLDIPMVLTTLAILFVIITKPQKANTKQVPTKKSQTTHQAIFRFTYWNLFDHWIIDNWEFFLIGFCLAAMYMTNAWDGMIYLLTAIPLIIYKNYQQTKDIWKSIFSLITAQRIILIFGCFLIFSLPFSLFFNPGALVGGIGLICSPDFLIRIGKIGPFVFEANHCMHSPLWQLLILYGFFLFWLTSFLFIIWKEKKRLVPPDIFVLILSCLGILLILIPEFFYLRDIYTTYFRANTMFKLVYQAFIMLSISTSYMIFRFLHFFKKASLPLWRKIFLLPYLFIGIVFFLLVGIYSYFAIFSYYNSLHTYEGINGITHIRKTFPTDTDAILWIQNHIGGQPVILEAQGDSYTEYARISANTGLPTVIGWPVHEWLWRGTYDIVPPRSTDVQTMYETQDTNTFVNLAKKYHVQYVFVGSLEKEKYPLLSVEKFLQAGRVVFHEGTTTVYELSF